MKIVLSAPWIDEERRASYRLVWALAAALERRRHEVHVCTSGLGRTPDRVVAESPVPVGVTVHELPSPSGDGWRTRGGTRRQRQWYTAITDQVTRLGAVDVVHHLGPEPLDSLIGLERSPTATVVGPISGGEFIPSALRRDRPGHPVGVRLLDVGRRTLARHPGIRAAVTAADTVLATTGETAALAQRLGAERVLIEPAIVTDHWRQADAIAPTIDDPLRAVWLGPPLPHRGLALALGIVAEVDIKVPIRLRVVGGVPADERLDLLRRRPGMIERVEPVQPLGRYEIDKLLADSDVLLWTALAEPDGTDVARALAAGLPVVALDHHVGADLLATGGGVRLPVAPRPATIRAGARALAELYYDRRHARALGAEGRAIADGFTAATLAERLEDVYRQAAAGRGRP
ncbi:MAG: glycosyltransferase family 4 protein [Actinomycetota bacterium]